MFFPMDNAAFTCTFTLVPYFNFGMAVYCGSREDFGRPHGNELWHLVPRRTALALQRASTWSPRGVRHVGTPCTDGQSNTTQRGLLSVRTLRQFHSRRQGSALQSILNTLQRAKTHVCACVRTCVRDQFQRTILKVSSATKERETSGGTASTTNPKTIAVSSKLQEY